MRLPMLLPAGQTGPSTSSPSASTASTSSPSSPAIRSPAVRPGSSVSRRCPAGRAPALRSDAPGLDGRRSTSGLSVKTTPRASGSRASSATTWTRARVRQIPRTRRATPRSYWSTAAAAIEPSSGTGIHGWRCRLSDVPVDAVRRGRVLLVDDHEPLAATVAATRGARRRRAHGDRRRKAAAGNRGTAGAHRHHHCRRDISVGIDRPVPISARRCVRWRAASSHR